MFILLAIKTLFIVIVVLMIVCELWLLSMCFFAVMRYFNVTAEALYSDYYADYTD